jgi:hypothetical protein
VLDQSDSNQLSKFVSEVDYKFDIIIDDGSHQMADQQLTFYYLSKVLKKGGIYIIEDLHTSLTKDKTMLYGKPIEINTNGNNTTLNFIANKPFKSFYLNDSQNEELESQYGDDRFIFERDNPMVGAIWGFKSITSVLIKKYTV